MKEFNKNIFKLGNICFRNHDYDGEGHSLRYISNNRCLDCDKITNKLLIKSENGKTSLKKAHKKYNVSENGIKVNKTYEKNHKERKKITNKNNYEDIIINGCKNPYKTNDQYIQELKNKDIKYIPLEEYKGNKFKILHLCPTCNNSWKVFPNAILRNDGCPNCIKEYSKKEKELD
jgi:hypothetical protein